MKRVECRTAAEFEACIKAGNIALIFGIRVEAPPKSTVEAWENSTVTARENSTVTARENSTVTARENSTVTARENSTVTAWENSTVTARENSTVTAWENSTVTAWGNSTVTARGNSTVTARGNSTVEAWENSTVTAWENSTVTAWENSTVTARGNVFVRLFRAASVVASLHVVVMIHGSAEKLEGGIHVQAMVPKTGADWCEYFGLDPATSNLRVPNIDLEILKMIEAEKLHLDMGSWHGKEDGLNEKNWCETTHCRAGAAVCLAGKAGFALERKVGAETAGQMIYAVSDPAAPLPDFFATTENALADIRKRAARQQSGMPNAS